MDKSGIHQLTIVQDDLEVLKNVYESLFWKHINTKIELEKVKEELEKTKAELQEVNKELQNNYEGP